MSNPYKEKLEEINQILVKHITEEPNAGILGGKDGLILYMAYMAKYKNDSIYNNLAVEALESVFNMINDGKVLFVPYSAGLAGTGWLVQHLAKHDFIDIDTEDTLSGFDELVYDKMIELLSEGKYDFLHEGLGITFYFLQRDTEKTRAHVAEAIHLLNMNKHTHHTGSYKWLSERNNLDGTFSKEYNISLSHGMASIVSILAKALQQDIEPELTTELLRGAVNYILEQENDFYAVGSCFPRVAKESIEDHFFGCRLGWCYGDLGIGLALYSAAQALKDKKLEAKAIDVFIKNTTRKDLIANSIMDASLCHGAAGVAHIFNRMYFNTGIQAFKEAANYWFEQTLNLATFADGPAGFKQRTFHDKKEGWESNYSYLEGIAGIGLALISHCSDIEPAWDVSLLMS